METALFSAYNKTAVLAAFAAQLKTRGWTILASAGTVKFLAEHGVDATDVATIVGAPILDHRVVTLSREIHAGLLARPEDAAELERLHIHRIDLVYVDLYPLEEEIARSGATESSVIEKTDIGGPTLLRAAAKGRRIVLSESSQFAATLSYIDSKTTDSRYLAGLAAAAEQLVSKYAAASAAFNARVASGEIS